MTEHRLERLFESGPGLFGELTTAAGRQCASMERLWKDDQPRVSCVRPGRYQLVPWSSAKFPAARALVGGDVGIVPGPGIRRSAVLIHAANVPLSLQGCIALGTLDPTRSILVNSRAAVRAFLLELDSTPGPHWLEIHGGLP